MPQNTKSPQEADKFLGRNIRVKRIFIGLSQSELGSAIGVTFQQVQKYENGSNRIAAGRLVLIANALGTTTAELCGGIDVLERAGSGMVTGIELFLNDPNAMIIVKLWPELSNKSRSTLAELATRLS